MSTCSLLLFLLPSEPKISSATNVRGQAVNIMLVSTSTSIKVVYAVSWKSSTKVSRCPFLWHFLTKFSLLNLGNCLCITSILGETVRSNCSVFSSRLLPSATWEYLKVPWDLWKRSQRHLLLSHQLQTHRNSSPGSRTYCSKHSGIRIIQPKVIWGQSYRTCWIPKNITFGLTACARRFQHIWRTCRQLSTTTLLTSVTTLKFIEVIMEEYFLHSSLTRKRQMEHI